MTEEKDVKVSTTQIRVIHNYEEMQEAVHKMSIEASMKQMDHRPMAVKSLIGDFHGCGSWRVLYPSVVVSTVKEDLKMVYDLRFDPNDQSLYRGFDLIVFQRQVQPGFKEAFAHWLKIRNDNKLPVGAVFEIDDWLFGIPKYNMAYDLYENKLGHAYLKEILQLFDGMTVSTRYLKKLYSEYVPENKIWVIPNFMPRFLWDYENRYKKDFKLVSEKPRILFAGGANRFAVNPNDIALQDDLSQIESVIRSTVDKYQWVFMGAHPLRIGDLFEKKKIEQVSWEANFNYPRAARKLKIDLAVSPLLDNSFNRAKSNIKILEYGALGIPAVYTDVTCYDELPSFMKVLPGNTQGWAEKIEEFVTNEDLRRQAQEVQLEILEKMWLEDNVDFYRTTYKEIIDVCARGRKLY